MREVEDKLLDNAKRLLEKARLHSLLVIGGSTSLQTPLHMRYMQRGWS